MPKPKKKRTIKAASPISVASPVQYEQGGAFGSTLLPRLTTLDERENAQPPDIDPIVAMLKKDLVDASSLEHRAELYRLTLLELERIRDGAARRYTTLTAAGELVNPEDLDTYATRLLDSIAKLSIERDRLLLGVKHDVPMHVEAPLALSTPAPMRASLVQSSPEKVYPEVMTAVEVAELLRYKLPRFYQVYKSLGIPFFMEGRQPRFEKADVMKWKHERKTRKA
ncbi:MAG: hypothetical protein A2Y38_14885 [Spirochaetes bacterium GWB1_59_5]|nr:MAG: hypothetical protein A2Y38_14885 [Spirochaetes bacterium GWB1_59_5]